MARNHICTQLDHQPIFNIPGVKKHKMNHPHHNKYIIDCLKNKMIQTTPINPKSPIIDHKKKRIDSNPAHGILLDLPFGAYTKSSITCKRKSINNNNLTLKLEGKSGLSLQSTIVLQPGGSVSIGREGDIVVEPLPEILRALNTEGFNKTLCSRCISRRHLILSYTMQQKASIEVHGRTFLHTDEQSTPRELKRGLTVPLVHGHVISIGHPMFCIQYRIQLRVPTNDLKLVKKNVQVKLKNRVLPSQSPRKVRTSGWN